jgi:hypothetical protein
VQSLGAHADDENYRLCPHLKPHQLSQLFDVILEALIKSWLVLLFKPTLLHDVLCDVQLMIAVGNKQQQELIFN